MGPIEQGGKNLVCTMLKCVPPGLLFDGKTSTIANLSCLSVVRFLGLLMNVSHFKVFHQVDRSRGLILALSN